MFRRLFTGRRCISGLFVFVQLLLGASSIKVSDREAGAFALLFKHDINPAQIQNTGKFQHPEAILWSAEPGHGVQQRWPHLYLFNADVLL